MAKKSNSHKKKDVVTPVTTWQAEYVHELKAQLLHQFKSGDRQGVYGYTQRTMGYHSNRIEGSTLTPEQTASMFDTGTITPNGEDDFPVRTKDIEEMTGHFLMFNHMLRHMDEPLSEQLIKDMHRQLVSGVFEYRANGYAVGDYKKRANYVGSITTSLPQNVPEDMRDLLAWYGALEEIDLDSIAEFHSRFEHIHPFQDGNGRVGRMILFRECARNDIPPVIIRSENKVKYIQNLNTSQTAPPQMDRLVRYMASEQQAYMKATIPMLFDYDKAAELTAQLIGNPAHAPAPGQRPSKLISATNELLGITETVKDAGDSTQMQ